MEKGILVLWWRDLTPEVFDYIANCDSNGKILNHALQQEEAAGKSRKRNRDDLGNLEFIFNVHAWYYTACLSANMSYVKKAQKIAYEISLL